LSGQSLLRRLFPACRYLHEASPRFLAGAVSGLGYPRRRSNSTFLGAVPGIPKQPVFSSEHNTMWPQFFSSPRRERRYRPTVEPLEDRFAPAVLQLVTGGGGGTWYPIVGSNV